MSESQCNCQRCAVKCKVDPVADSKAKMLRRNKAPKGLCVNCAVHDFLRNTYPVNLILAQSGAKSLAFPHIQEQFAGIMKSRCSDALPDEIGWQAIIDNWNLPFPTKLKSSAVNPVNQEELDRAAKEGVPVYGSGDKFRSKEEQIEEQKCKTKETIRKMFPDGEIVIE